MRFANETTAFFKLKSVPSAVKKRDFQIMPSRGYLTIDQRNGRPATNFSNSQQFADSSPLLQNRDREGAPVRRKGSIRLIAPLRSRLCKNGPLRENEHCCSNSRRRPSTKGNEKGQESPPAPVHGLRAVYFWMTMLPPPIIVASEMSAVSGASS
jgi:hypothetical protein